MDFMLDYPNFLDCSLQTFDDNKERKEPTLARIYENNPDNFKKLKELNDQGAGIFFSVNSMRKGERSKDAVTNINAWVCEVDDKSKEEQMELVALAPIEPDCLIESKNSYHMYWFAKDWSIENYEAIGMWLKEFFGGDVVVARDYSRVLRLPWFYHCKDENDKFLIECLYIFNRSHTEQEMMEAYPYEQPKTEYKIKKVNYNGDDDFWYVLNSRDAGDLLKRLSWTYLVSGEQIEFKQNSNWTYQIFCNNKSTWCRLDEDWKIWSHDHWWPSRVNRIKRYGKANDKEIAERAKSNCKDLLPKKEVKTAKIIVQNTDIDFNHIVPYTWWIDEVDKKFGRYDNSMFNVIVWESGSWKTEYTFFQARQNAKHHKVCYLSLEMTPSNMIKRYAIKRAWVTKTQRDDKTLTNAQKDIMTKTVKEISSLKNLVIMWLEEITKETVIDAIEKQSRQGFNLFYVDNLGFISKEDKEEIDHTAEVCRLLKSITNRTNVSINLIHHFNKWWVKDRSWPRWLASIRSSGKIENDADNVMQVWRDLDPEVTDPSDRCEVMLILQKDRIYWDPCAHTVYFHKWEYLDHNPYRMTED